ncbi:hypothetical protein BC938DRAFT_471920 [Jimgerdemannia flammicorona]|uniref:Uncharacterized protein n=1 Tax=Jimgerdemannia flammicorona TaxID=994334 RepID=A0A433Q740_9FUNG|nr:hypothetical protein BC938DRAFT_471920 [Jimgerdemannia flammicorona]
MSSTCLWDYTHIVTIGLRLVSYPANIETYLQVSSSTACSVLRIMRMTRNKASHRGDWPLTNAWMGSFIWATKAVLLWASNCAIRLKFKKNKRKVSLQPRKLIMEVEKIEKTWKREFVKDIIALELDTHISNIKREVVYLHGSHCRSLYRRFRARYNDQQKLDRVFQRIRGDYELDRDYEKWPSKRLCRLILEIWPKKDEADEITGVENSSSDPLLVFEELVLPAGPAYWNNPNFVLLCIFNIRVLMKMTKRTKDVYDIGAIKNIEVEAARMMARDVAAENAGEPTNIEGEAARIMARDVAAEHAEEPTNIEVEEARVTVRDVAAEHAEESRSKPVHSRSSERGSKPCTRKTPIV